MYCGEGCICSPPCYSDGGSEVARPSEISKPFAMQMMELVRALQLIGDSIKLIHEGRSHHLVSLSGQLRSLLTDNRRSSKALLIKLAQQLEIPISIYCMPDVNDPMLSENLREGMMVHIAGFPITKRRQLSAQQEMSFAEFLDHEIIFFNGNTYSTRKVIEWYANNAGGSHYSRNLPADFATLLSLNPMGLQPIANVLLQLGEAAFMAGRELLKSIVDLEIYALIALPPINTHEVTGANYLFDFQYGTTAMGMTLSLNKALIPSFIVSGLQGVTAKVTADRIIDWSSPHHLRAAVTIDDDLSTVIELDIDGERVGRYRCPEPIFVLSDPKDYELYHNRAVKGEPQNFSFSLAQFIMYGAEVSHSDRAQLLLYLEDNRKNPELPVVFYSPLSFAFAKRGSSDLAMSGDVKHLEISNVLNGALGN